MKSTKVNTILHLTYVIQLRRCDLYVILVILNKVSVVTKYLKTNIF